MPRPKKTHEEKHLMRERILDCANAILQEDGPEAMSSRAIAERMGMAHMSLYTYFVNQRDILQTLSEREWTRNRAQIDLIVANLNPDTVVPIVQRVLQYMTTYAVENPNMYKLAWISPHMGFESHEENLARLQDVALHFSSVVGFGIDSGVLIRRDPLVAAITALTMVNSPFFLYYSGKIASMSICKVIADEMYASALQYLGATDPITH